MQKTFFITKNIVQYVETELDWEQEKTNNTPFFKKNPTCVTCFSFRNSEARKSHEISLLLKEQDCCVDVVDSQSKQFHRKSCWPLKHQHRLLYQFLVLQTPSKANVQKSEV